MRAGAAEVDVIAVLAAWDSSDAREVKHVNMRRHVVEYRIVHGTPVPVAGTPGRDVPLFRSQKASVEHAIAISALASHVYGHACQQHSSQNRSARDQ